MSLRLSERPGCFDESVLLASWAIAVAHFVCTNGTLHSAAICKLLTVFKSDQGSCEQVESEMRVLVEAMEQQKATSTAKIQQLASVLTDWNVLQT